MVNLLLDSIELLDSAELLHPVRSIDAAKAATAQKHPENGQNAYALPAALSAPAVTGAACAGHLRG